MPRHTAFVPYESDIEVEGNKPNVYNWDKESNRGREKTMTRKISFVIREPAFISNETSADSFCRERHCPFAILSI